MNCINLYDGVLMRSILISGSDMVNVIVDYLANKTADILQKVVLLLFILISKAKCELMNAGLGKVDMNMLVLPIFRIESRIFLPDSKEGWTSRFLIPPAFSKMVHEDHICGCVRTHLFG